MNSTACILLLTGDAELESQWADMLHTADVEVIRGLSRLTKKTPLDVVVTDQRVVTELLTVHNKRLARGEIGIVAVGYGGLADVNLPADCTPRELRLACQLLAEIVRQRRQRRRDGRARKVLTHLALSDPLTGLPNRRAWDDELPARFRAARARGQRLCLALFDLDEFKVVNDQSGHLIGDEVLRCVGQTLAQRCQPVRDYAARLGGDEFGMLMSGFEPDSALELVDQIRAAVPDALCAAGLKSVNVSAGIALAVGKEIVAMEHLWHDADKALRQAKKSGRNQSIVATAS